MAYRYGDRKQRTLFPQSIDEYIAQDAPVRAYDVFVDSLDFTELSIEIEPHKVGCPQYSPQVMLKLLLYGYSYGVRSSRKLEREVHYNLSFIWLTGGLKPDHKTIAEFRKNNKVSLGKVLKQCARLCVKLDLIEGNTLFVDGTKIRANASNKNSWSKDRCNRQLEKIDKRIKEILLECDVADRKEDDHASLVKMKEELKDQGILKSKVKNILKELKSEDKKSTNTTDSNCKLMHSIQGSHLAYNVQSVVDEKHGLIVSSDVVNENNDIHQFADQVEQANETLGKKCQAACADAGYASVDELEKIDEQGIKVVVPSQKQALKEKKEDPFDKSHFKYDPVNDCYICPQGHALKYSYTNTVKRAKVYRGGSACRRCCNFGKCTKQPRGRGISRLLKAELKLKLEAQYEEPDSQKIYALRKQKVELPFGHIKRNLKVDSFLLRRLDGVKAEASVLASCFNIARMISIIGVTELIATLGS
jgi:transposase